MEEEAVQRVEMDAALADRLAGVRKREHVRLLRRREWVWLAFFFVLALAAWINFQRVIIEGRSMEPTFHNGQAVLVWKLAPRGALKPGDVIVFREGPDELIKRIVFIARPSDPPRLPPPGFPRRFTNPEGQVAGGMLFQWYFFQVRVGIIPPPSPQNTIYVMGDNFPVSDDSRHFGPINPNQILGKVVR